MPITLPLSYSGYEIGNSVTLSIFGALYYGPLVFMVAVRPFVDEGHPVFSSTLSFRFLYFRKEFLWTVYSLVDVDF